MLLVDREICFLEVPPRSCLLPERYSRKIKTFEKTPIALIELLNLAPPNLFPD
jgi:hypothetical protein